MYRNKKAPIKHTHVCTLNEEVPALTTPVHRQHIFLFALAFSNQEVPIVLQQFLNLQTGDGTVIPALLGQGLLHLGHRRQGGGNLARCIKYTTLQKVVDTTMSREEVREEDCHQIQHH